MNKDFIHMGVVEFYITNVCNLTCQGCNRFNNYKFSGFQKWTDLESVYTKWAEQLRLTGIGILGGEPLLNPEYMLWLQGLRNLWPNSTITTTTNGYRLNQVKGLYDYMLAHKTNTFLSVGIHNKKSKSLIMDNIEKFLTGPIHYEFDSKNQYRVHMILTDANGVQLKVEHNWWFHQGALVKDSETGKFSLHQSDPAKAHDICHSKYCHHFMDGKLYKCGAVALFPEFDTQHNLQLTAEDRELMNSYSPLTAADSIETKREFIKNLPNSIPQCKFCPEQYHGDQIFAEEKRVVFKRNIQ
jgi:organic radical activating enzyme